MRVHAPAFLNILSVCFASLGSEIADAAKFSSVYKAYFILV
jgi:hypothetical protein